VQWSAADTVEELRRRCERATGQRRSDYLLVKSTRKPMRDHLLVQDYGLNISQRVRLVTDGNGSRLRGGARGARARTVASAWSSSVAEAGVDVLPQLLDAIEGLGNLKGWKGGLFSSGLKKHRDASKCEGVTLDADGRVIKLEFAEKGLSGAFATPPSPHKAARLTPPPSYVQVCCPARPASWRPSRRSTWAATTSQVFSRFGTGVPSLGIGLRSSLDQISPYYSSRTAVCPDTQTVVFCLL
jgi:hypothetical protein